MQCILLKVALLLGVEIHENVTFDGLVEPPEDQSISKQLPLFVLPLLGFLDVTDSVFVLFQQIEIGWKAKISPADHPVSQYEFDVLIGADGKRNTLDGT